MTIGSSGDYDYASLLSQSKLNAANSLLGNTANTNVGGGISGDTLQQWSMLRANSAAYRKLLEAQETGSVKQASHYSDLLSDKLYNDHYDADSGKVKPATYSPDTSAAASVDSDLTAGEILDDMRSLALAAIGNSSALAPTHYDLFEQMRSMIANGLTTSAGGDATEVTVEDAAAATISATFDFRLLTEQQNFTIAGKSGEKTYNFNAGDSLQSVADAINADSAETGVKAELSTDDAGNHVLTLSSTETGKDAFVRIDQNVGSLFADAGGGKSASGADAVTKEAETVVTGDDARAAVAAGMFGGALFGDEAFTIQGNAGSQSFAFAHGVSAEEVIEAINAASERTGVTAEAIRNSAGGIEGIGLLAAKAGSGQYVQVTQTAGDLFADAGKTIKVSGSSSAVSSDTGAVINSLEDLGRVTLDGKAYSFADLGSGGAASLAKNPDAALAVLDQTLRDLYSGRAVVSGFDPDALYASGVTERIGESSSTNGLSVGDFGSDAMKAWLGQYVTEG